MLKLVQFPPLWGAPSAGPFSVKLQAFMNLHAISYEIINAFNPGKGPKSKLPYIVDENGPLGDSSLIIEYLSRKHGIDMESWLSREQRAVSLAFRSLCDDRLYWALSWSRWVDPAGIIILKRDVFRRIPAIIRPLLVPRLLRRIRNQQYAQGMGRHSQEEIEAIAKEVFKALADFLADKPYFFGDKLSLLDVTASSYLISFYADPFENAVKAYARTLPNLVAYTKRMQSQCFGVDA